MLSPGDSESATSSYVLGKVFLSTLEACKDSLRLA
jgi:hypothetical protein